MSHRPVSVVVVSRHRPERLAICLRAISQLYYPNFEVIVVADTDALRRVAPAEPIRSVAFDVPNIAVARNLGVAAAAGEVIAFIDDDAVPEPTWLDYLTQPFNASNVAASGGYVVGRNGFSLQWGALSVDREGWDHPIEMQSEETVVLPAEPGQRAIRTQGTNMAIRRSVLADLGGFDPAFHFLHEESDLNMRIARAGLLTAIVPRARVVHFSAPSERRRRDRTPRTLYQIGTSTAVFHKKYLQSRKWARAREEVKVAQRRRLVAMMVDGRIEPRNVEFLTATLLEGYDEGLTRQVEQYPPAAGKAHDFARFPGSRVCDHRMVYGPQSRAGDLKVQAQELAEQGFVITCLIVSRGARYHHLRFTQGGYWEQKGGLLGRSLRTGPLIKRYSLDERQAVEMQRIAPYRNPAVGL